MGSRWCVVGWCDFVGVKSVVVKSVGVIRWCEAVDVKSADRKSLV